MQKCGLRERWVAADVEVRELKSQEKGVYGRGAHRKRECMRDAEGISFPQAIGLEKNRD